MRRHGFTRSSSLLLLLGVLAVACGGSGIVPSYTPSEGTGTSALTSATGTLAVFAGVAGGRGSADGMGSGARFYEPAGVAVDGSGNVYVADTKNSTIRKVTPDGVVTTLAGSAGQVGSADGMGSAALFYEPTSVAADGSGNVYVADTKNFTIRKITPDGSVTTLAGSAGQYGIVDGTGSAARFLGPTGVAVDGSGNVYVADYSADTIRKVTPTGAVTTLAGSAGQSGSIDDTGPAARFNHPAGVAVDGIGNVYVADYGNKTIRKITPTGAVTTLAGSAGQSGSVDGTGPAARFSGPGGVTVDGSGNLYVADTWNDTIRKVTPAGAVTTVAGSPGQIGSADGTGTDARFDGPGGVAVDGSGNLYVADTVNDTIRKVTTVGAVNTLAGTAGQIGSADGTGVAARFDNPAGVAVDGSGNVYVADTKNSTIRKVTPDGAVTTLAGSAGQSNSADGTGSAARFAGPQGVAADPSGNVYVADSGNDTIRKVTPEGVVTTLAGSAGQSGSADGTGSAARFNHPAGVAVDGSGNVYVADTWNSTIRKITSEEVVTTLAGSPGQSGSQDGTGSAALFNGPTAVALDASGNVYVADFANSTIRKITPERVVTTLGGSPGQFDSADGTGSAARFAGPQGVAVDGSGNVYVADYGNNTIRKVAPAGVVTTVVGEPGWPSGNVPGPLPASLFRPSGVAVGETGNLFITVNSAVFVASDVVSTGGGAGSTALTISPTAAAVATGQIQAFTASGGTRSYTWSVSTNNSGGAITSAGVYTAGSTGGVSDTVTVTDSNNTSVAATVTVTTAVSVSKPGGGCGQGSQGMVGLVALLLAGTLRRTPIRAASLTSSSSLRAAPRTSAVLDPRN